MDISIPRRCTWRPPGTCRGQTASVTGVPGGTITTILHAYISRCCFLLRQGSFVGDVLVYSPQATVWTKQTLFGSERRNVPYGDLPLTLVANGYDFDPVNDDVLQNRARVENGHIKIR